MSDTPDNNVLDYLREQFSRTNLKLDDLRADMAEVKQRLTTVEIQVGNLSGAESSHYGQTMQRLGRIVGDIARIKIRLDLVEAPAA
jgi:hypothetical protein